MLPDSAGERRRRGSRGEDIAHRYLQRQGLRILARNWTGSHLAETDIVASDGEHTIFVEVKSLQSDELGSPARSVTELKICAQRRAAYAWARRAGIDPRSIRFDLVTVVLSDPPRIEHLTDVWGLRRKSRRDH